MAQVMLEKSEEDAETFGEEELSQLGLKLFGIVDTSDFPRERIDYLVPPSDRKRLFRESVITDRL
ncbi:hypothetical protein J6590_063618 [Homalodisca vitripennis]|nr:hypothetical protein J6590_063618 [Homalodisca vitripennis]